MPVCVDPTAALPKIEKTQDDTAAHNTPNPEFLFRAIEQWDGPYASARGVLAESEKWRAIGGRGAEWLIRRTADETDLEILSRVATVLSEIGAPGIPEIIKWLKIKSSEEHQCALLQALAWMDPAETAFEAEAVKVVRGGLESPSCDVREKAISAAKAIPAIEARNLLKEYLLNEKHSALKTLAEEALRDITGE